MFFALLTLGLGLYIYFKNKDDNSAAGIRAAQVSAKTGIPPDAPPRICDKGKLVIDKSGREEHAIQVTCPAFSGQKLYIDDGVPKDAFEQPLYKKLDKCGATPDVVNKIFDEAMVGLHKFLSRRKHLRQAAKMVSTILREGSRTPEKVRKKEISNLIRYISKRVRPIKQAFRILVKIQKCFLPTCNDCAYAHLMDSFQGAIIYRTFAAFRSGPDPTPTPTPAPNARGRSDDYEPIDPFAVGGVFATMSPFALQTAMSVDLSKSLD